MTRNILHVTASSRHDGSVSRELGRRVLARLGATDVTQRDLTTGMPPVTDSWITGAYTPPQDRTVAQNEALALSDSLIDELKAAETILISSPLYNFSIPSALKAWIDQIARVGVTFEYTDAGPRGLLSDKQVIIALASGGVPIGSDMDFASPYLRFVLGFLGLHDVQIIGVTGMDAETALSAANAEIATLAI